MSKIKVAMDPEQRQEHINKLLELDGLPHITEDINAAYCPISLTNIPDELKPILRSRQKTLIKDVLEVARISAYDPSSAPFSPEVDLTTQPEEVYAVDSGKIVGARFFVSHNLLPSTGQGVEAEQAKSYNRIAVMLMDDKIRVSRMQPHRIIYLQYTNFHNQAREFVPVFEMLRDYDPGMGFNRNLPVLLGFGKSGGSPVDLEETIYQEFPELQYHYNGKTPILKLRAKNPNLFYENDAA